MTISAIAKSAIEQVEHEGVSPHPAIPLPPDLYGADRRGPGEVRRAHAALLSWSNCCSSVEPVSASVDENGTVTAGASGTPSAARPMTDFEKLDLYHRRYTAAANNIAQLYKQLIAHGGKKELGLF